MTVIPFPVKPPPAQVERRIDPVNAIVWALAIATGLSMLGSIAWAASQIL